MKGNFDLHVNNISFSSSEAIYQSLKFPDSIEIQRKISAERSPMTAKRIAQCYSWKIRPDWENRKVCAMRIALRIKALQSKVFYELLLSTKEKEIVEISRKDNYWGAYLKGDVLVGMNVLGRLLMEVRGETKELIILHIKQLLKPLNNMKIAGNLIKVESLI